MSGAARPRLTGARVLLAVFVLTLPLITPRLRGADEIEYFAYLHSAGFDHDLAFGNEYQHFYALDPQGLAGFKETFLDRTEPATGRHINFAPLGTALLWSPFYLAAHLGTLGARALGASVPADGYSRPYLWAVCLGSAVYGLLGLLLMEDALRRFGGVPEWASTMSALALWLGSPVLYYLTIAPGFSHACSLFVVSLLLWCTLRAHARGLGRPGDWAVIGLLGGLAALVREQDGLYLVAPGIVLLLATARGRAWGAGLSRAVLLGGCALLAFLPQLFAYHAINGRYGPSRLVVRKMTWSSPHFLQVLFDPGHGLFLWSPLLLVGAAGLMALLRDRERRGVALALLAAVGLQVWINGAVESWTQAGAFGSRRFVSATFVFAWGLGFLLRRAATPRARATAAALLGLFVLWNAGLMVQFGLKLMDRQQLTWPAVAVNQVRAVPPRLARATWLFFTDRERLVQESR